MQRIPEDPTIHIGLRLNDGTDYDTIIERVEYGGFGVIAFGPNRRDNGIMIAYKTLRRDLLNDPQTHATFVRECLLWVGLWDHPNVAKARAALRIGDEIDQRPFLALAYAQYGSLREMLRGARKQPNGRLPLPVALLLAQQIAAGLAYLHRPDPAYLRNEPTVHRDLKPENVLLMEDGRAVITDFGLAKAVEASPNALALLLSESAAGQAGTPPGQPISPGRQAEEAILLGGEEATQTMGLHTARGVALGTIPYMAPEQWEDARYAGTATDIYALGIMLSEIVAGRHALLNLEQPHSQAEWRRAHSDPHPRPLREVAPDAPASVEAIYQRCLAADPEDRPTADEALAALQAGAREAGLEAYVPFEMVPQTPFNEFVHWHVWSVAYANFGLFEEALARSDRAIELAQRLAGERPDLLPDTLMTRGTILKGLGAHALAAGKTAEAAAWDRQVETTYQASLSSRPPATTPEGSFGRALVWHQIGVFNNERERYAYADDAYGRALALKPDMPATYFARGKNQFEWGVDESQAGRRQSALAHLRQARVYAVTSIGMNYPTAQRLLKFIEDGLAQLGAAG